MKSGEKRRGPLKVGVLPKKGFIGLMIEKTGGVVDNTHP